MGNGLSVDCLRLFEFKMSEIDGVQVRGKMKTNPLGDIRAEHDHAMLDKAFYETSEFRSLIEEDKRRIVVGRRGTGKSALHYRLQQHWNSAVKTAVIVLTPNESEVICAIR